MEPQTASSSANMGFMVFQYTCCLPLFLSKLGFIQKTQHRATRLMKKSCLLNELFPLCCHCLGVGRGNAVPARFSHRCTVPAEFPHASFLASSLNDSSAIFRPLLSSAVG